MSRAEDGLLRLLYATTCFIHADAKQRLLGQASQTLVVVLQNMSPHPLEHAKAMEDLLMVQGTSA